MLLVADPGVEDRVLSRFAADLTAHLDAEASILSPILERAFGPLTTERELQSRLRQLLSRILPGCNRAFRNDRLMKLRAAFQEHSHFVEQVALPALLSVMDERSLEALGRKMHAAHLTAALPSGAVPLGPDPKLWVHSPLCRT
jgi:hypothetical protein